MDGMFQTESHYASELRVADGAPITSTIVSGAKGEQLNTTN